MHVFDWNDGTSENIRQETRQVKKAKNIFRLSISIWDLTGRLWGSKVTQMLSWPWKAQFEKGEIQSIAIEACSVQHGCITTVVI